MSISKRLFVGNVHADVKDEELKSRFAGFGTIEAVEKRTKNDEHFAFINMVFEDVNAMRNCIETLHNTRWKGLTLKVQYAKESFWEKLKKEREAQGQRFEPNVSQNPGTSYYQSYNNFEERRPIRPERPPKPPDNFDFEIISTDKINSSFQNKPLGVSIQKDESHEKKSFQKKRLPVSIQQIEIHQKKSKEIQPVYEKPKFTLQNEYAFASNLVGFDEAGIINAPPSAAITIDVEPNKEHTEKMKTRKAVQDSVVAPSSNIAVTIHSPKSSEPVVVPDEGKKKKTKLESDESDSDESSNDERDGIPRFRGLASFSKMIISPPMPVMPEPALIQLPVQFSNPLPPPPPVFISETTASVSMTAPPANSGSSFKLKVNPYKKAKSDELRLKSLSDREAQLSQRANLIRQSLATTCTSLSVDNNQNEKVKDTLFLDDPVGNDDNQMTFEVKPQFEGTSGRKLLQLKSKYGGDSRFQLDERFVEESPTLGTTSTKNNSTLTSTPKRFIRFDPTLAEHQKLILNPEKCLLDTNHLISEPNAENLALKRKKPKEKDEAKAIDEEKAKLRDPTTKATFKVAQNLKALFSKDGAESVSAGSTFSVLKTFGTDETSTIATELEAKVGKNKPKSDDSKPRDQWTKNPFKYDSSDDEEVVTKKEKVKAEVIVKQNSEVASGPKAFFKQESFFFTEKDERLKGVFDDFLKLDENSVEVTKAFQDNGRQELKAIAQSKMKNAKRKGEKKMNFMKILRKKKKREAVAKQKKYEERRGLTQNKPKPNIARSKMQKEKK